MSVAWPSKNNVHDLLTLERNEKLEESGCCSTTIILLKNSSSIAQMAIASSSFDLYPSSIFLRSMFSWDDQKGTLFFEE